MSLNKVPMTVQGEKALQDELEQLKKVDRPRIVQAIAEAREHGDLKENAEYQFPVSREGNVVIPNLGPFTVSGLTFAEMKAFLKNNGVVFYTNERVADIKLNYSSITQLVTDNRVVDADEVVLAAGSWSSLLSKKIGMKLLLQAGKGYRINTRQDTGITIPSILAEAKAAVTPMNGFTRFAGTMEIAGINHNINQVRVEAIANAATRYYPNVKLTSDEKLDAACGLRPVSPDGLPYIGKSKKCNNLTIAAGHAMMGWSMGTATGKVVSEIISDKKTSLDLTPYHPDRTFYL